MQKQSSQNNDKKSSNQNKKLHQIDKQLYSVFLSFQYDKEDDEEYILSYRPKIKSKKHISKAFNMKYREKNQQREGLYLRAKFRFITSHDQVSDTSIFSPMKQLQWEKITQVLYPSSKGEITCPICMNDQSQIVAPQITPCGHIYCWHCYLRHDDISETKNYCPLCSEFAPNCDLKSAEIIEHDPNQDKITFELLVRQENEQTVYQADTLTESKKFSKIMIAKSTYIKNEILLKENKQLQDFMLECISSQETWNIPYIEQALELNEKKLEKIEKQILIEEQERLHDRSKQKKKSLKLSGSPKNDSKQISELNPEKLKKSQLNYFYQEQHGQLIFLNPINNKYFFEEINKENRTPPTQITAKLNSLQNACVDQNLLKRYPYLKHLPPYCDVTLAEIDMSELIKPENAQRNNQEIELIHKKLKEKEERELKKMSKNRKMSDNPYGQFYDREYYLMNGLIQFPPSKVPTEEKHYPSLSAQNSQVIQQEEEQKLQNQTSSKKQNNSDNEDDYVIVSESGKLPSGYVGKQSRQKIKEMQNQELFPSLGGLSSASAKSQSNRKKASSEFQTQEIEEINKQEQLKSDNQNIVSQITEQKSVEDVQNKLEIEKQNEQKQVIVDLENNVIIDGDQIYDQWSQQQILSKSQSQNKNIKNKNEANINNNNKKKNKKIALDGNFFF